MSESFTMGSIPMGNFELERKILTCLLNPRIDKILYDLAMLKILPIYFFNPLNRALYKIIQDAYQEQKACDLIDLLINANLDNELNVLLKTISDELGRNIYNFYESDIDKLINTYTCAEKITKLKELIKVTEKENSEIEALSRLSDGITEIANFEVNQKSGLVSVQDAVVLLSDRSEKESKIKTNLPIFNDFLSGGFEVGSVATFVAQPRMGKTFFSIYLMDSILQANPDTQALFFSLEMPIEQIIERHTALKANRIYESLTPEQKNNAFVALMQMNYKLCDVFTSPKSLYLDYICNYARIENSQKPISVIVIDYMTKITTKTSHERDDLKYKHIASKLADLAVELKCVIINLMHSNRSPSERPPNDRCPRLDDETQSQGAGTSSGYWFGIDRPELHCDDEEWKQNYKNLFILACRKSRFCPEFMISTNFNSGLFGSPFYHYSPKLWRNQKDPSKF